ncbi:MAG: hypothetical protein HOP30_06145 [Cyclobacteriaceae bacterium]|nr:hypothetical protein [Cyclobacteriaceae bacterium]
MKKILFVIVVGVCFIWSCGSPKETTEESTKDSVVEKVDTLAEVPAVKESVAAPVAAIEKDTVLDNAARFIAGLPQLSESSFKKLQEDKYWKEYQASMDANWKKMYDSRLSKMKAWEENTFSKSIHDSLTLFYPFSGPDFLHAFYLFPRAKTYVLAALEPIREVVPLDTISEKNRDAFLDSLGVSLRDIFNKSYFITTHMEKDLKQVKGVLPPLYFFIERSGHELLSQKFITLDDARNEVEIKGSQIHWKKTPAVKLVFRDRATQEVKTLYYFSVSISNGGLKERPNFISFVKNRAPFNTFVKSASYLMHKDVFTEIKKLIIANSNHVFQDDTGIPYKNFKNKLEWSGVFYGDYIKPVSDFSSELYQADLDSAYKAGGKKDLPFSLGYHWSTKKQNYMLFSKAKLSTNK